MTLPATRDQVVTLLQKLGWDDNELSPEERESIRHLYRLDDDRPVSGKATKEVANGSQ